MNRTLMQIKRIRIFAIFCLITVLQLTGQEATAQTTLSRGDIAIVGWNSVSVGGSDQFTFVSWVPLTANTVIKFTNNRWQSNAASVNSLSGNAGSTLNQIVDWTNNTGSTIPAGTVILIQLVNTTPTTSLGAVALNSQANGTLFNLSNGGQRIFIYQGSDYSSGAGTDPNTFNGTILYGLYYQGVTGAASWLTSGSPSTNNTYLPSELNTTGYNIVMGSNAVGGDYQGSRSSQSSFAAYQALVSNSANYTANVINPNTATLSTTAFTLATTDYYYKGTGALTTLANWGTNTDGTGTAPSSFTTSGSVYRIANTTGTINLSANWTVGSTSGGLNIGTGIVLGINGNTLDVSGAISGSGLLAGSSTSNLTLTGTVGTISFTTGAANRTLHDLTLNSSTTATLGSPISITAGASSGTVTVNSSSTLTTGGNLTLASDASGTARIGTSAGTISGNVTMQRYIPGGKRALRWFAHPFSTTLGLDALIDNIDITGSGGSTNGFTTTSLNAPSSYWFNVATADNTTDKLNPGWTAFTNTNGVGANAWAKGQGVSVLFRGSPGQGLGTPVTPNAVTLDATGSVNQGSQVLTVTKGSGSTLAFVGNPFPSQVNMNTVTKGGGIGSSFYIWNPNSGVKGAFVSSLYSSGAILPSFAAFMTLISSTSTITFAESDKVSSAPSSAPFKSTGALSNRVFLKLYSDAQSIEWDQYELYFDNNAAADSEWNDAPKFMNPDASVYSFSKNNAPLAIDVRPYKAWETIPMGLQFADARTYKFVAEEADIPVGGHLFLNDKYLNKVTELTQGASYEFDVTADPLSQGTGRFELNTQGFVTGVKNTKEISLTASLIPNPANEQVTVHYIANANDVVTVSIMDMTGRVVYKANAQPTGSLNISLSGFNAGVYIVEVKAGEQTVKQKLVKE